MAQNNLLISLTSIFFFVLILSQSMKSIEGRYLNPGGKNAQILFQNETVPNLGKHEADIMTSTATSTNVSPPAPSSLVVGASQPPPSPGPGHGVDDFRPTAPGHSPGVGHSIQN
ncbi:Precursor of CEP3 [Quillaja saponaria]|uniref:Precursor of CEP3 n=1 Tax=Quillaja saponaria TaxID=32244 RepID=A0AAD7L774_QUISA|nr:Precursor of CEP3 [Quillaja saponaria]